MKVTCRDYVQKVGLYNKKTKIYQIIKGLIILFIKLQFSIRCNQAFRPLYTSISKYLPQPQSLFQRPRHLHHTPCIRIISNTPHDSRHAPVEVSASNLVKSRSTYLSGLEATGLLTRKLSLFLSLPWRSWKQSWRPHKREVLAVSSWTYIHIATKRCLRVIYLTPWQVGNLQDG